METQCVGKRVGTRRAFIAAGELIARLRTAAGLCFTRFCDCSFGAMVGQETRFQDLEGVGFGSLPNWSSAGGVLGQSCSVVCRVHTP